MLTTAPIFRAWAKRQLEITSSERLGLGHFSSYIFAAPRPWWGGEFRGRKGRRASSVSAAFKYIGEQFIIHAWHNAAFGMVSVCRSKLDIWFACRADLKPMGRVLIFYTRSSSPTHPPSDFNLRPRMKGVGVGEILKFALASEFNSIDVGISPASCVIV